MAGIYENAHLTIAATEAEDGHQGLLIAPQKAAVEITLPSRRRPVFAQTIPSHTGFQQHQVTQTHHVLPPLITRAWVFQERMLSRRVLQSGRDELLLECGMGQRCEGGMLTVRTATGMPFVLEGLRRVLSSRAVSSGSGCGTRP